MTSPASRPPLAYDDMSTPEEMRRDARVVVSTLRLDRVAQAAVQGAPSLRFEDYPREVTKHEVSVSAAAARLAGSLHLHLH